MNRRAFLRLGGLGVGSVMLGGAAPLTVVDILGAPATGAAISSRVSPLRFAYIADSHVSASPEMPHARLALERAVREINALDPAPAFVVHGGDLAHLGREDALELGAEILARLEPPVKAVAGEHDWYLDLGARWQALFGPTTYAFDAGDTHFVVLHSAHAQDFWSARQMAPSERMLTAAGLDNGVALRFELGEEQRAWLDGHLSNLPASTRLVLLSHVPLYDLPRPWPVGIGDADWLRPRLARFQNVVALHGHTHRLETTHVGGLEHHGLPATAWPLPAPPSDAAGTTFGAAAAASRGHASILVPPRGEVTVHPRRWR